MINLLPPEEKQNIAYARRNTMLVKWSFALLAGIIMVLTVTGFGYVYLNQAIKSSQKQVAATQEQLKVQKLTDTQKRVEQISTSLKLVVQVLGKEVLYSKLIQQIGSAMPPNTVLTNLSINKLQGGIDLQASATDYQSASQVVVNLNDPSNKIFTKADLITSQCGDASSGSGQTKYPCTVTIRAQFASNNPYLFINNQTSSGLRL
jgi:Tfp pilus assembly protein PilN